MCTLMLSGTIIYAVVPYDVKVEQNNHSVIADSLYQNSEIN